MGRVSFHSPDTAIKASSSTAFAFLSNLDNMEKLMPEQVVNWKSDRKSCSFDIKGMAHIQLLIGQLIENQLVTVDSGPDNPIVLQILFNISTKQENNASCQVTLNAELSMMLELLASNPLQNLVNIMAEKMKTVLSE